MRYGFTSAGYLEYVEDHNGNRITVTTDSTGKITAMSDPSGLSVGFAYSGSLLKTITDNRSGRTAQYTYLNNYLDTATDSGGYKTFYGYNTNNVLAKITSVTSNNIVSAMTYNTTADYAGKYNGFIKTVTNDQGLTSTYDYSSMSSRQIKITDYNSITTQNYSLLLDITKTTIAPVSKPNNPSDLTVYGYNSYHEVTESKDILGNKTNYEYDSNGNLIKIIYPEVPGESGTPARPIEEYKYDLSTNDRIEYTDKNGSKTFYAYDTYHNLVTVTRPLNGTNHVINSFEYYTGSSNTYPVKGLLKKETGPLGNSNNYTRYEYVFTPNAVSPNPVRTVKTIKCVGGSNYTTSSEYDRAGRLVKETTPMGIATTNEYDVSTGLLKKIVITDNGSLQQTTEHEYDAFGNETKQKVTYPDGSISETTHTSDPQNGNLLTEKDPDGITTTYQYENGNEVLTKENDRDDKELTRTVTDHDELNHYRLKPVGSVLRLKPPKAA